MSKTRYRRMKNESTRRIRDGGIARNQEPGRTTWVNRMDSDGTSGNSRQESREDNESKGENTGLTSDDNEGTDSCIVSMNFRGKRILHKRGRNNG